MSLGMLSDSVFRCSARNFKCGVWEEISAWGEIRYLIGLLEMKNPLLKGGFGKLSSAPPSPKANQNNVKPDATS